MPRLCSSLFALVLSLPAVAAPPVSPLAFFIKPISAASPVAPVGDPFPIRRTFITGERLAAVLGQAAQGALTRLPRDEFEAKVRAAARASAARPPALIEAHYRATLTEGGLTGTANWRVTSAGPGLLPLEPLRVALAAPKWANGIAAAIVRTEPAGGKPAAACLLVESAGDNTVSLNWSARGTEEPAAERFELTLPAAPIATLELDLPTDRVPALASPDQLLTGPLPGSTADRRIWRIGFGGQSRVEIAVRRPGRAGEPEPAVRANRAARYDLTPGVANGIFEFTLEPIRGHRSEFLFNADPGLRITDVTGPGRLSWRTEPGQANQPTRLRVTSQDPAAVGRVTITGFAALPATGAWPCPRVWLADGLPGRDTIDIRIDSELKFLGCEPGDYRVTTAGADLGYRISLTGALLPAGERRADRRPPSLHIRATGAEYSSIENVTWRVAAGRTDVAAQFRIRVSRGPLAQIPVHISPGLSVESVRLVPDDPSVSTRKQPGNAGILLIEPSRPIHTGQSVEVQLTLRGPPAPGAPDPATIAPGRTLAFPFATLAAATERDGVFNISVSPAFRAWPSRPPEATSPLSYSYRGQPPHARLTLVPRSPRVTAASDSAVSLEAGELTTKTTLTVRTQAGEFGSLLLFTPLASGVKWDVRADGATVKPLPGGELLSWTGLLAAGAPWSAITSLSAAPRGVVWRLTFARPVSDPVKVVATAHQPAPADASAVAFIPTLLGVTQAAPQVGLTPSAAGRYELASAAAGFPGMAHLRPRGAAPPAPIGPGWEFTDVRLMTQVEPDGRLACTFAGLVKRSAGARLPIELPNAARVTAALVAGKYVSFAQAVPQPASVRLTLPLPVTGPAGIPFEVRYHLPHQQGAIGGIARRESQPPELPGEPLAVETRWSLAPEFRRWPLLDSPSEPVTDAARLMMVPSALVSVLGYASAALAVAVGLASLARLPVRRRRLVALSLALAALGAANWLAPPGWQVVVRPPLLVGLLVLTALVLAARRGTAPAPVSPPLGASAGPKLQSTVSIGAAILLLVVLTTASFAVAPEPVTVFVIADSPDADRLAVLAPPAFLARLDALAHSPAPPVAVVDAEYEGSATANGGGSFTARFQVLATRDGPNILNLPLTGVRLEGMELDGKPAYPEAPREGLNRYTIAIRGSGRHELTARFAVPPAGAGADREVRFGTPDIATSRIRFTGPPHALQLDVASRRGAQTDSRDGDRPRVSAAHGGGRTVAIRWRDGSTTGKPAAITVREACVWDVSESGWSATAAFLYRIDGGSASRLRLELPDGLEPGKISVRTGDGRIGPGLRDWRLGPGPAGWRTLDLGLQGPAEGRVAVLLRLYPRTPPPARPVLRFPRASGTAQTDSYYAIRFTEIVAESIARAGVIDYPAEAIAREFLTIPELGLDRAPPDRAFQRSTGPTPELRPQLRPSGEPATESADITWTIGQQAEAEGVVRITRPSVSVAEFDLPASVRIDELHAPDLQTWRRSGSRVQVWLRKPARDVAIRWSGSLAGYPPRGGKPNDSTTVELPFPRAIGAISEPVSVRVRAAEGWAIRPRQTRGLKPRPRETDDRGEAYQAEPNAPYPRFAVYPPRPPRTAAVLESVDPTASGVRYRAVARLAFGAGQPHHFTVRLIGLPPSVEPDIRGPAGVRIRRAGTAWDVVVPSGARGPLHFTLTATLPALGRLPEPVITLTGPPLKWSERVLAVRDTRLTPTAGPRGWEAATQSNRLRATWPGEAEHLTRARIWQADGGSGRWTVSLSPDPEPARVEPAPAPTASAAPPNAPTRFTTNSPRERLIPIRRIGGAAAWLVGLTVVLLLALRGRSANWPERLLGCGLLGVAALGVSTPAAVVFWSIAAIGLAARITWAARRAARLALRTPT
jgi:hypothetical protein